MAKAKKTAKAPKQEVELHYSTIHGTTHAVALKVPVTSGQGEKIINDAERHGCTDIAALRAQISKHY